MCLCRGCLHTLVRGTNNSCLFVHVSCLFIFISVCLSRPLFPVFWAPCSLLVSSYVSHLSVLSLELYCVWQVTFPSSHATVVAGNNQLSERRYFLSVVPCVFVAAVYILLSEGPTFLVYWFMCPVC